MREVMFFLAGLFVSYILSQPGLDRLDRMRRRISWRSFARSVRSSMAAISASGFKPDVIIGLNSGIVPASIIALNFGISDLYFYSALPRYQEGRRTQSGFVEKPGLILKSKRVLVVDDQTYTGRSLEAVVAHLESLGVERDDIRTHVLYCYKGGAGAIPVDIAPAHYVQGNVKLMPWVISDEMRIYWQSRESSAARNRD